MELPENVEGLAEPEIGLAAIAVAALFSPRVRRGIRWGLVTGLSGLLAASDSLVSLARHLTPAAPRTPTAAFRQHLVSEARVEQANQSRARRLR